MFTTVVGDGTLQTTGEKRVIALTQQFTRMVASAIDCAGQVQRWKPAWVPGTTFEIWAEVGGLRCAQLVCQPHGGVWA